jgi:leucyl-tRNA synthetase
LGEVIEIVTTTNVHESKEFKEQMGVRVRTDKEFKKEHPEYVSFIRVILYHLKVCLYSLLHRLAS